MSKHWSDTSEELEAFYAEIAEEMVARRLLRVMPENAVQNDAVLACVSDFIGEVAPIVNFTTRDECLTAVLAWISGNEIAEPIDQIETISVSVNRTYGAMSMNFGYSARFVVKSGGQRRAAYAFALREVEKQFDAFATQVAVDTRNVQQPSAGSSDQRFMGDEISVELKDDTLYYKIKGGQFTKYGVRVWPEVLTAAGIPFEKLQGGKTYNLKKWCTYSTKPDGKPEKVTYITNA